MQSCVHSFFLLPDRPTHLHEREGDGKLKHFIGMASRNLTIMNSSKAIQLPFFHKIMLWKVTENTKKSKGQQ